MASMTVACSRGTRTAADGRATPSESTNSAASSSANVRCRRQPGPARREAAEQLDVAEPRDVAACGATAARRRATASATTSSSSHRYTGERNISEPRLPTDPTTKRRWAMVKRTTSVDPVAVGAQLQVRRAGVPQPGGDAPALLGRGRGVPLAQPRRPSLHLELTSGLRVDERDQSGGRQLELARIEDLDAEQLVAPGQRPQRPLPRGVGVGAGRVEEVGDHGDQAAAARRAAQRLEQRGEVAAPAARSALAACVGDPLHEVPGVRATGASRDDVGRLAGADDRADPVAAAHGQVHDRGDGGQDELALLGARRTEVHARRQVDDQPGLELAVGDGLADVRHGRAGRDRPVHPAHVVTEHVLPRLPRLRARTGDEALVVALQQPVQLVADRQFEAAQQRRPRCAGRGSGRGR